VLKRVVMVRPAVLTITCGVGTGVGVGVSVGVSVGTSDVGTSVVFVVGVGDNAGGLKVVDGLFHEQEVISTNIKTAIITRENFFIVCLQVNSKIASIINNM